jgi:hypothetical protein
MNKTEIITSHIGRTTEICIDDEAVFGSEDLLGGFLA